MKMFSTNTNTNLEENRDSVTNKYLSHSNTSLVPSSTRRDEIHGRHTIVCIGADSNN